MRRSATGIDISEEAVNLAKSRLAAPVRSHSLLHENGRESYRAVDETALRQLVGLEYVPIHRNSGIDAILKQDWKGSPVTIRVQRAGEPLLQAAESLRRASISRGARIMFVIAIERGGTFDFANALPPGIVAIDSPALCVREYLEKLASLDPQVDGGPTDHSLLSTAL
jgi:site-specific DNA-methyltransferase (adenine-specific)